MTLLLAAAQSGLAATTLEPRLARPDAELGQAAVPSRRVSARKRDGSGLVYDVVYTMDECGGREVPAQAAAKARPVLFLGDSNTFGVGVSDGETLPAAFQAASRGRWRAVNLAFPGYGPHQLLRQLETGREACGLRGAKPAFAVYFAIDDHPARAAGRAPWDPEGPRYEAAPGGGVRYAGRFHGRPLAGLIKSFWLLGERVGRRLKWDTTATPADEELFTGIVAAAAARLRERYGAELVLIAAGEHLPVAALKARGVRVLALPDLKLGKDYLREHRLRGDGHPSAEFHKTVGEALARRLEKAA